MKVRTFVCVELPGEERERLGRVQASLKRHRARVSWPAADNLHLTLAFLGDVDEARIPAVVEAVSRAAAAVGPIDAAVSAPGGFPSLARPRVLWVGLTGDVDALASLQAAVARELEAAGFALDRKPFKPHLTLGRVKDDRDPALRDTTGELSTTDTSGPAFRIGEVVVMRSELSPAGARYTPLARAALGGAAPGPA